MTGTFVTVGNAHQAFERLLSAIVEIKDRLPKPIIVQKGHTLFNEHGFEIYDFISMNDFSHFISNSKLIIMHAGAGSVIHAIRAGKKPIVMPRISSSGEHINDHQLEFANELGSMGKVYVAQNATDINNCLSDALNQQQTSSKIIPMISIIDTILKEQHALRSRSK